MSEGMCILELHREKEITPMHVLQWLAVEAEDEETAAHVTTTLLENQMGDMDNLTSWYDWFIVGGGRWNVEVDDGIMSAYTPKTNMIISYAKNPNEFYGQVQECIANRIDTYNEYYKEIEGKDVMAMFANYGGVMSYSLETYPFRNLLRFLDGDWFYDSKFFDLISDSTNATHLLAKLDSDEAKNFFLVPVDFHF